MTNEIIQREQSGSNLKGSKDVSSHIDYISLTCSSSSCWKPTSDTGSWSYKEKNLGLLAELVQSTSSHNNQTHYILIINVKDKLQLVVSTPTEVPLNKNTPQSTDNRTRKICQLWEFEQKNGYAISSNTSYKLCTISVRATTSQPTTF